MLDPRLFLPPSTDSALDAEARIMSVALHAIYAIAAVGLFRDPDERHDAMTSSAYRLAGNLVKLYPSFNDAIKEIFDTAQARGLNINPHIPLTSEVLQ